MCKRTSALEDGTICSKWLSLLRNTRAIFKMEQRRRERQSRVVDNDNRLSEYGSEVLISCLMFLEHELEEKFADVETCIHPKTTRNSAT